MKRLNRVLCALLLLMIMISLTACGGANTAKTYDKAQQALTKGEYEKAAELFENISSYEDSSKMAMYSKALLYGEQKDYTRAIETLTFLGDFKDSNQLITYFGICQLSESLLAADILSAARQFDTISAFRDSANKAEKCRQTVYDEAVTRFNNGDYETAILLFTELGHYKDSESQVLACENAQAEKENAETYTTAEELLNAKDYDGAISLFSFLGDYKDSRERVEEALKAKKEANYIRAEELLKSESFDRALEIFESLGDYRDSITKVAEVIEAKNESIYRNACSLIENKQLLEALDLLSEIESYKDVKELKSNCIELVYTQACELAENNNFSNAIELFNSIPDYKDSSLMVDTCLRREVIDPIKDANVGDVVVLGRYIQAKDTFAADEPLSWIVISKDENKLLLLSEKCIEGGAYNNHFGDVTWETCSLRKWLNNDFYIKAFSPAEKQLILCSHLTNNDYHYYDNWFNREESTPAGNDTDDNVFLLSIDEIEQLIAVNPSLKKYLNAGVTMHARIGNGNSNHVYVDYRSDCASSWWTRTPGDMKCNVSCVHLGSGELSYYSYYSVEKDEKGRDLEGCWSPGIRPAIWIDITW